MSTTNLLEESPLNRGYQICYEPQTDVLHEESVDFLIFMITGNPGLISYYEPFLSTLYSLLGSSKSCANCRFIVYGQSFAGFDVEGIKRENGSTPPIGLRDQIKNTEDSLFAQIQARRRDTVKGKISPKVILMGHSVGAYILLELISQHRKRIDEGQDDFDLIGGILLFPTITHIAESQQGKIYNAILQIPHFAQIVGTAVKYLFYFLPTTALTGVIKFVMRYPEHAAQTTADFIKSSHGVRQALHLAKDEMQTINEDKWEKEIWEAATSTGTNSLDTANKNLFFFWGKNDKLVANNTRDELIKARDHRLKGTEENLEKDWKPTMDIDDKGIPHAFCLKHSEIIAEKVKPWIEEIVSEHSREIIP